MSSAARNAEKRAERAAELEREENERIRKAQRLLWEEIEEIDNWGSLREFLHTRFEP